MAKTPPPEGAGRRGPGLAKARPLPFVETRTVRLARATDGRWRALFAAADVLSEGAARQEARGTVWYGSTMFVVPLPGLGADERALVAAVAERDLHVRLRALRVARREASLRSPTPLGTTTCVMRVAVDSSGLRIDVDVEAPMMEPPSRAAGTAPDGTTSVPQNE